MAQPKNMKTNSDDLRIKFATRFLIISVERSLASMLDKVETLPLDQVDKVITEFKGMGETLNAFIEENKASAESGGKELGSQKNSSRRGPAERPTGKAAPMSPPQTSATNNEQAMESLIAMFDQGDEDADKPDAALLCEAVRNDPKVIRRLSEDEHVALWLSEPGLALLTQLIDSKKHMKEIDHAIRMTSAILEREYGNLLPDMR